jgi:hypothetical protein
MADTTRSLADLTANFLQDGQPDFSISAQDIRDLAQSAFSVFASNQAGSYTIGLGDLGTTIRMTSASANNLQVPTNASVAFPVGSVVRVRQIGAGVTTVVAVTPATTTLTSSASPGAVSFAAREVGSLVTLTKDATDLWYIDGDLAMSVTIVALDVSTVTTGGTAVTALTAGHRRQGGFITNPTGAPVDLIINELTTASGTVSSGSNVAIGAGATYVLAPSPLGVSVISSSSSHVFAGQGRT